VRLARRLAAAACLLCGVAGVAGAARAQDVGIFHLYVNLQAQGDVFVRQTAVGDYWIKLADLHAAGLADIAGETRVFAGEPHLRLSSLQDVLLDVDSRELTISITLRPDAFGTQNFSLSTKAPLRVTVPNRSNAQWNYRVGYEEISGQSSAHTVENLVRAWSRGWLFQYQDSYASDLPEPRYVRQSTNLIYDLIESMQRFVAGDIIALSGELGTTRNLAGLGFSRVFDTQPSFVSNPTASFLGSVSFPSTAEIYVDGVRVATQRINPGNYQFNNLDYYGGLRNTEVVIRDPYGGRRVLSRSYYFTDQLLKAGLQDYSYNLGVERHNVGTRSNDYSGTAWSAYHRYGWSDRLTVGLRGDGNSEAYSAGPAAAIGLGDFGIVGGSYSLRHNSKLDQTGDAWLARYSFDSWHWSARAQIRESDRAYSVSVADPTSLALPRRDTLLGVGYNSVDWGNLSYSITRSSLHDGSFRNANTVGYSINLKSALQLFATVSRVRQDTGDGWEGFVGASLSWGGGHNASVTRQRTIDAGNLDTVEVSKSAPEGEGSGYRVAWNRTGEGSTLEPFGQLNTRYWIFTADASVKTSGDPAAGERFGVAAAGAVVFAGGQWALTRPVQSSFAMVKVAELEGVRVYRNNQEAGRTDGRGLYVIPTVSSYAYNSISIEPQDIPLDYKITALTQTVVPPLGAGVLTSFDLKPIRAYEGTLKARLPRGESAVEHISVSLTRGERSSSFITGYGGEFYLEDVEPGDYRATFLLSDLVCRFVLRLPQTSATLARLDPITATCEPPPLP
jgi:outer membrane usher protein